MAKEEYLSLEEYEQDLARLSELFNGVMHKITILGGEPLLHPQVEEFIKATRKYFPIGDIKILTNGILLPTIADSFWEACRETGTTVYYTKYLIKPDVETIREKAEEYGVALEIFNMEDDVKQLVHEPLDLEGKQNAIKNFYDCYQSNTCITLKHGKLYTCLKTAHICLMTIFARIFRVMKEIELTYIMRRQDRRF